MSTYTQMGFCCLRYGRRCAAKARDYAATATVETFDPNAIDPLCRYAILQAGTAHVLQTNMTASQLKKDEEHISGRQAVGDGIIPIRGGYGGWRTLHFAV